MKIIYENEDKTYKVCATQILGYNCQAHFTNDCGVIIRMPMGKTPEEKAMFDDLVYYNQSVYNAPTVMQARKQIIEFIRDYKKK